MELKIVNYYTSALQRQIMLRLQTVLIKEVLNFNTRLSLEMINQISQSIPSNNPSNTGLLIDLRV